MEDNYLSKLAQSSYWQTLYNRAKEIDGINLVYNKDNFSLIQVRFFQLLQLFSRLYEDLAMREDYLSEEVIKDPIRREAYLLMKREDRKKEDGKKRTTPSTESQFKQDNIKVADKQGNPIPKITFV